MALPKIKSLTYTLTIPSTGKEIEYQPYTVKQEKALMLAKGAEDEKAMVRAIKNLLDACFIDKVDVEKLTTFDFEYIFLQIRAKSVGETSTLMLPCQKCEKSSEVDISIDKAEINGEVKHNQKVMINKDIGLVLKYPPFTIIEKIRGKDINEVDNMISIIMSCIDSVFDQDDVYPTEEQTDKELREFVESIPSSKFQEISAVFQDIPTVSLDISFKCMPCGEMNNKTIEGLGNFF